MKALILAGGFGTRLKEVVGDVPKPMAPVLGKPFIEHQILFLKEQGITDIILSIHHMSEKIKSYFGNGQRWALDITYSEEDFPLGTAGAIKKAERHIDDTFIVMNGDSYCDVDLKEMINFHRNKRALCTISLKENGNYLHYGNVELDGDRIKSFAEKEKSKQGIINTGVYIFEPGIFNYLEPQKSISLEKEIFPLLAKKDFLRGYLHKNYFMDIGRPETYNQFKEDVLSSLFLSKNHSIKDAIKKISKMGIDLVLIVNENRKLLGVITERIINRFLLAGGRIEERIENVMATDPKVARVSDDESKIQEMLVSGINRLPIVDENGILQRLEFRTEKIVNESYPIVRGSAPLRISFAGGGTDMSYFFEKHGGIVISSTINKYCHGTIVKRADSRIIINSDIYGEIIFNSRGSLTYDGKYDLIKAVINIMKPSFGFELYLHNDLPPGRGLGSSASVAVLVASLLSYLNGDHHDDYKIAEIAYKAEREELSINGGWQDQYAAITGGFNFMEFGNQKNIIYPLRLKQETINEFSHHLTLCCVGGGHFSGDLQNKLENNYNQDEEKMAMHLNELKNLATKVKDCLLTNEFESIGSIFHETWERKKSLNNSVTNEFIDRLYNIGINNGAIGGRLLGAGAGGYILFLHPPHKKNQLKKAIESNGGEIMPFAFEFNGTTIHPVKNRN